MSVNYTQVFHRFVNCDFCGVYTRGRIWDDEPDVIRCGACEYPLSGGVFVGKEKAGTDRERPERAKNKALRFLQRFFRS